MRSRRGGGCELTAPFQKKMTSTKILGGGGWVLNGKKRAINQKKKEKTQTKKKTPTYVLWQNEI